MNLIKMEKCNKPLLVIECPDECVIVFLSVVSDSKQLKACK